MLWKTLRYIEKNSLQPVGPALESLVLFRSNQQITLAFMSTAANHQNFSLLEIFQEN